MVGLFVIAAAAADRFMEPAAVSLRQQSEFYILLVRDLKAQQQQQQSVWITF